MCGVGDSDLAGTPIKQIRRQVEANPARRNESVVNVISGNC